MEAVSNHLEQLAQQLHRAFVNRVNQHTGQQLNNFNQFHRTYTHPPR
jgi:hypothetical protein